MPWLGPSCVRWHIYMPWLKITDSIIFSSNFAQMNLFFDQTQLYWKLSSMIRFLHMAYIYAIRRRKKSKTLKHHKIIFIELVGLSTTIRTFLLYIGLISDGIYMPFVHGNAKIVKIWLNRLESIIIQKVVYQTAYRLFSASYSNHFRWHLCMPFVHRNGKWIKD